VSASQFFGLIIEQYASFCQLSRAKERVHHTTDWIEITTEGEMVTVCCTVTLDGKACPEESKNDPKCAIEETVVVIVTCSNGVEAPREEEVGSCILVEAALKDSVEVDDTGRLDLDAGRDRLLTDCTLMTVFTATVTGVELVLVLEVELLVAAPIVPDGFLSSAI